MKAESRKNGESIRKGCVGPSFMRAKVSEGRIMVKNLESALMSPWAVALICVW
jgi:hypothetical protein